MAYSALTRGHYWRIGADAVVVRPAADRVTVLGHDGAVLIDLPEARRASWDTGARVASATAGRPASRPPMAVAAKARLAVHALGLVDPLHGVWLQLDPRSPRTMRVYAGDVATPSPSTSTATIASTRCT